MNDTLPNGGARFALPDEPALLAEEAPESFGVCEDCGEPLLARHVIGVCNFCADIEPAKLRCNLRHANRVPETPQAGAGGRLLRLGARRLGKHRDFWLVPGVDHVMNAREALANFGPDELPAKMRE